MPYHYITSLTQHHFTKNIFDLMTSEREEAGAHSEAADLAALRRTKHDHRQRWEVEKTAFELKLLATRNQIEQVKQEIHELNATTAAERAADEWNNGWAAWLLSFVYELRKITIEEKERKDMDRRERSIRKSLMETQVQSYEAALRNLQASFERAKYDADAAIKVVKAAIWVIKNRIYDREYHRRVAKTKQENERLQRIDAAIWGTYRIQPTQPFGLPVGRSDVATQAIVHMRRAEAEATQQRRHEQEAERRQNLFDAQARRGQEPYFLSTDPELSRRSHDTMGCIHDGWWDKVQGRAACPDCHANWNYLLQCPNCVKRACPKCRDQIRRSLPRGRMSGSHTADSAPWTHDAEWEQ
jgi:hypothetical protein